MANQAAFVLSRGVEIDVTDDELSIRHDGDVVIEQTLGRRLKHVEVTGNLTIRIATVTGVLIAGGTLTIEGDVDAVSLRGRRIIMGDQSVAAKSIGASESISIGAAKLQVDAVIAPTISLDRGASGRVTVIESHNERAPTMIKGGFSLADYADMFGDATGFLSDRGLSPLDGSTSAPVDEEASLAPLEKESKPVDDEDVDDPLSLSLEDLEPVMESASEVHAAKNARIKDAMERVRVAYGDDDVPPAVMELQALVDGGDLVALASNVGAVWNGLLAFHQKRGIRPHHQVTHAFNVIHSLVS